ncbi:adenosinetriphosphatase [Fonticula alba]|uniref:microtubule-severing ATPase n=1 Tax=Fonticula alba TaxID=691883 RepID=A0A058Z2M1_FONAL|nr:adenosinetriphosphatase [Fonticula alba]KCV68514.1 adenosinetriphosphatase [Fonticula alba]|eukprot:XP_009496946.1 adenosinetriphosphatase [Fonticula alba]
MQAPIPRAPSGHTSCDTIALHKRHYDLGIQECMGAVRIDETGTQPLVAIEKYRIACQHWHQALQMRPFFTEAEWQNVADLDRRISSNFQQTLDRLFFLEARHLNQKSTHLGRDIPPLPDFGAGPATRRSIDTYDDGEPVVDFITAATDYIGSFFGFSPAAATSSAAPAAAPTPGAVATAPAGNPPRAAISARSVAPATRASLPPAQAPRGETLPPHLPANLPFPGRASTNVPPSAAPAPMARGSVTSRAAGAGASSALAGIDPQLANSILDDVITPGSARDNGPAWDDIAGLANAKQALHEAVILPALRPDLFSGLRAPVSGILLFGPPGTGKTLLARACASQARCTFFNISAASLTAKYVGDSEKRVRALFALARELAPSIIFVDEIDSILSERSDNEHEAARRLKTEFLIQFDGVVSNSDPAAPRVLVLAATNRPGELDQAVRRRLSRRIYIPLPDLEARVQCISRILQSNATARHAMSPSDVRECARLTEGYSPADLAQLCKEAAMLPIRELGSRVQSVRANDVRPIGLQDFRSALARIRPTVSPGSLRDLERFDREFGSYSQGDI